MADAESTSKSVQMAQRELDGYRCAACSVHDPEHGCCSSCRIIQAQRHVDTFKARQATIAVLAIDKRVDAVVAVYSHVD